MATPEKNQGFSIVSNLDPSSPSITNSTKPNTNFFSRILNKQFGNGKNEKSQKHYCETPQTQPATPLPQKLFFKPGVVEEMEEEMEYPSRAESPLMYRTSNYILSPVSMSGLNRTSTCNSTLSQMAGRQDSR